MAGEIAVGSEAAHEAAKSSGATFVESLHLLPVAMMNIRQG